MAGKTSPKTDINLASKEDLVAITGIGESLAQRIIDYRPFTAIKDLVRVPGISDAKLNALLPYLKVQNFSKSRHPESAAEDQTHGKSGHTEAFVFLEERSDRQDALLLIFGGFILGLILLMLRRRD